MVAFGEFPFSIWIHVSRVDFLFFLFVLWQPRCRGELFRNLSKKNPLDVPCCKQDILTLGKRSPAVFSRRYRGPVYQFSKVSCTSEASNKQPEVAKLFWILDDQTVQVYGNFERSTTKQNTAVFALVANICIQIYVYNIYIYIYVCIFMDVHIYTYNIHIYLYRQYYNMQCEWQDNPWSDCLENLTIIWLKSENVIGIFPPNMWGMEQSFSMSPRLAVCFSQPKKSRPNSRGKISAQRKVVCYAALCALLFGAVPGLTPCLPGRESVPKKWCWKQNERSQNYECFRSAR